MDALTLAQQLVDVVRRADVTDPVERAIAFDIARSLLHADERRELVARSRETVTT